MKETATNNDVELTGYYPGVLGKITELHAVYYHEHWEFDISFETQVGMELCEFMSRFRVKPMDFGLPWSRAVCRSCCHRRESGQGGRCAAPVVYCGAQFARPRDWVGPDTNRNRILQKSGPQAGIFVDFQGPGSGPQSV